MSFVPKSALALSLFAGTLLGSSLALAATITVNTTGLVTEFNVGSITVTGAASGFPEDTNTSAFDPSGISISTSVTTSTNSALVVDVVGSGQPGAFTPGAGQSEHYDASVFSATGAMSSKTQVIAGLSTMMQTHTPINNRLAHAVIAVTPDVAGVPITVVTAERAGLLNASAISWSHANVASAETAKLFVGVSMEDNACTPDATVTSVTFGNLDLTRLAAIQTGAGFCQRVEIWYVDLPHLILSVRGNSVLGGVASDQDEAVEYDAADDAGTLFLDDTVFAANKQLDAIHVLSNGNVAISTNNNSVVDGTTINRGDVAEITTGGTFVQFLFDGNTQFTPAGANIDAVWVNESNGNIVLSTTGTASLPGLANFQDEDIVEFDGATAVMLFDGSVHITGGNVDKDVDAVHVLDDDNLFVSLQRNHSVAGVSFRDGDVILVENPSAVSPTASLHMTEFVYTGNDDTDAISFEVDATPVLDHFDLMFVAAGSTCLPSEIVIEAKDAGGTTITTYTGTVTLSTSTGNGDWTAPGTTSDPAQGTFTPGAADSGNATYTFVAGDAGDIAILLANEHAETLTMTVDDAGAAVTSVSGNLTFSDNVFVITPTTSGGDNVVAGRDHVFHIEMIRSAPPACGVATGYNNPAQTLKAWIVRDVDDPGGGLPTLAEQTAALGEGAPPAADNLQLDFLTVPGESDFTLQTTDVGKFVLNIRDDTNGFAAVDIDGATNTLTVRPFGYDVQVTGNPAASGPGGSGFVSAGTAFAVTVTAVVWESADDDGVPIGTADDGIPDGHESGDSDPSNNVDLSNNPATPAYGQEPAIEVVGLSALLDQPGGGNDPGLSGGTSIAGFVAGVGSTATAQYDEVGIVEIRGVLTGDGVYLGGQAVQGASGFVGRFFPDHFELDLTDAGFGFTNRSDLACASSFTYMDENFSVDNYQIIARSVGGGSTQNYEGAFANLALPGDINFGAVDVGAIDLTTRLSVSSFSGSFSLGVALIDTVFSLGRDAPNIDGPFDAFNVGVAPEDTVDSVTLQTFDLDVDIDTIDDHATLGATVQRFGRLFIEPTFGSEIATLPVPMHTELFDGSSFVINADDNCTPFAVTDLILSNNIEVNQTDGDIIIVGVATTTATIVNNPVSAGDTDLSFSRPGAGNVGFTDVTTDLATLGSPYLFYDWDSDGVFDNDPVARVTFGIFQGPSVIIYRREPGVFQ